MIAGRPVMGRARRLPKKQRRRELLAAAEAIVRAEGTEALTLARVADYCGVTKPIAYEHFGTRAGLLMELYRGLGDMHAHAAREALAKQSRTLDDATRVLSAAYIDCVLEHGSHYSAIMAALSASTEMESFRQSIRDGYVDLYLSAVGEYVKLPTRRRRVLVIGLLGAAETLSEAAVHEKITRREAIDTLAHMASVTLRSC